MLGARRAGSSWMALCPAHRDRTPSLSVGIGESGHVLVYCHAGCTQASVIAALRERGLWSNAGRPPTDASIIGLPKRDAAHLAAIALRIWQGATLVRGSLVQTYMETRGLDLPACEALRFTPNLRHPSHCSLPAMVALVTRGADDRPLGIHRTFLSADGCSKASVEPPRMMLGPCRGGAVQLASVGHGDTLLVGEGIETTLAAMQATGSPGWAALSTSGLRALDLPPRVRQVTVLADGDDAGEAAAVAAAQRWASGGRHVRIARAPRDLDFNDLLLAGTGAHHGANV